MSSKWIWRGFLEEYALNSNSRGIYEIIDRDENRKHFIFSIYPIHLTIDTYDIRLMSIVACPLHFRTWGIPKFS